MSATTYPPLTDAERRRNAAIDRFEEEEFERAEAVAAAYRKLIGEPDPIAVKTDAF